MKFLFFSLAKHQTRYFGQLLQQPGMQGRVVLPGQLPFPALGRLGEVIRRVDWPRLVEEKCQERRVKGKYEGLIYRLLLRLEMLVMALRCAALLARERPDALVVWNGSNRHCQLMLALLAPGTRTFFFENGLLPRTTTLDPKGVNYHNSVPRDAAFYRAYAQRVAISDDDQPIRLIPRKPRSEGPLPVTLPERFIFIPFQDDRDTQVRLFSPWIHNMRELFALGERIARESCWAVVFKEHPSSREQYPDLHQRCHERLLFANGNPTQELIEASALVVSINSTVGLESVLLNKPLLTLGQAFFNVEGVVMHADSAEEALALIDRFPNWPVEAGLRRAFLHYLSDCYCVPGRWQDAEQGHLAEAAQRLQRLSDVAVRV
mgnify:CR=1 FL=1